MKKKKRYVIEDWAGNRMFPNRVFNSFEEAWDFIYANVHEEYEGDGTYEDYFVIEKYV